MRSVVWVLDEDEDNLAFAAEVLGRSRVVAFASVNAIVSHAARSGPPHAAVIDAPTATGRERDVRRAIGREPVVLHTWPPQRAPWIALGVTRFLLKPFAIDCLLANVEQRTCGPCGPVGCGPVGRFRRTRAA